jgi:hypothetical protein
VSLCGDCGSRDLFGGEVMKSVMNMNFKLKGGGGGGEIW